MEKLNDNSENVDQGTTGVDALSNMPSFEEMRRQNTLPEGVRDEQDYRDYMMEQQARSAEKNNAEIEDAKCNKEFCEEISKLEKPQDKYLAIALLDVMVNGTTYSFNDQDVFGRNRKNQSVLLEYINRDNKEETIDDFIDSKIDEARSNGSESDYDRYDYFPLNRVPVLEVGARIQASADNGDIMSIIKITRENDNAERGYKVFNKRYTRNQELFNKLIDGQE